MIKSRAPLRVGIAGGGSDIKSYFDEHVGFVLNATIDKYAYTVIEHSARLTFISTDLGIVEDGDDVVKLILHKETYSYFINKYNDGVSLNLKVTTFVDAPIGSGLGSSSTLVVSMIKGFDEYFNSGLDDYEIAELAYYLERDICKLDGGKQDQYSATFGGVNFIEFHKNRTVVNSLKIKNWIKCELESNLLLFFTGISRESSNVIEDQRKAIGSDPKKLEAMHKIKTEASEMKESILKGNFNAIIESLKVGWESKKASSSHVTNEHLNEIYDTGIDCGASAGKISGAGGGGFFMFYVPITHRATLIKGLQKYNGQILDCHFVEQGAQSWKL
ncbi:dehydrogenase [Gammaproteobacteria bacterium]|nr:dehydrogenase [Gammaproteobacteria bacterium]